MKHLFGHLKSEFKIFEETQKPPLLPLFQKGNFAFIH